MTGIAIPGAGPGSLPIACAMPNRRRPEDRRADVGYRPNLPFVRSNPRFAVGWRGRSDSAIAVAPHVATKSMAPDRTGAKRVYRQRNTVETRPPR